MVAGAFEVSPSSNISNGGTYDISSDAFFWDATFFGGEGAGSASFTFGNALSSSQTAGILQGTVPQKSGSFNGITVAWNYGQSQSVAPATNAIINVATMIAGGASDILTVTWGSVTGSRANTVIDIQGIPTAVPLPATGVLLLCGLPGLGALRRKRVTAAP